MEVEAELSQPSLQVMSRAGHSWNKTGVFVPFCKTCTLAMALRLPLEMEIPSRANENGAVCMGLIRSSVGAVGGTLVDQWKDFLTVPDDIAPTTTLSPSRSGSPPMETLL